MSLMKSVGQGGCGCGLVRYQIILPSLITHCCHCRYCQRQTGSAFVLNALVAESQLTLLSGEVEEIKTPSPSGKGQNIVRCCQCKVAVWSHYFMGGIKKQICFVRVGTLDVPDLCPPDVHIYTNTKQAWVTLPGTAAAFETFYDYEKVWTEENNALRKAMLKQAGSLV